MGKKNLTVNIGCIQSDIRTKSKLNYVLCSPEIPPWKHTCPTSGSSSAALQPGSHPTVLLCQSQTRARIPVPAFLPKLAKSQISFNLHISQFFHLAGCKMLNSLLPAGILNQGLFQSERRLLHSYKLGIHFRCLDLNQFRAWN